MNVLIAPFRLLLLCFVMIVSSDRPVGAQEVDALRFFQINPSRGLLRSAPLRPNNEQVLRQREPVHNRALRRSPSRAGQLRLNPSLAIRPELSVEKSLVVPTTFIHVVGDSLSELLAQGLKDGLLEKPEIAVVRHSRSSSGIVRDDYFNWAKTLRDLLAGTEKIDLLVMMVGSNDRQPLRDETGNHEFRSDTWRDIYIKRLDDIMGIAREKRVPLIWVGLPVMQSQKLSADMLYLNSLYRERASRAGLSYVDVWEGFANDQGQYASLGPDVNGTLVKLRTIDGVHFTKAGARKLAFFVGKETDVQLNRQRNSTDIAAFPPDVSERIRREQPAATSPTATLPSTALLPSIQDSMTLPEVSLKVPSIGERPLMGSVLVLTQPPISESSKLLQNRAPLPANEMNILTEQVMGYGKTPVAKTGRVDDFRWTPVP